MDIDEINKSILLLLVKENNLTDLRYLPIEQIFIEERRKIIHLCLGTNDNIDEIIDFIAQDLKPKLPTKVFNYCKDLDKAFQSVIINIDNQIQNIKTNRTIIYTNKELAEKEKKEFDLDEEISSLKERICENVTVWFNAFEIDFTYEKAKNISSVLVYSHRLSGWSNPEYKITENLIQEVKTNFGYGRASYFYTLLTFKNILNIRFSS